MPNGPDSTVDEQAFSDALLRLRKDCREPTHGLFGPDSQSWRVNRECILLLGGGAAALLQLAHPFVAHAVAAHSVVTSDIARRFRRTFSRVLAMTFGDLNSAIHAAERVHAIHHRVQGALPASVGAFPSGTRYQANDRQALLWVLSTLIDGAIRVYGDLVQPLSPVECAELYRGSQRLGLLFGLLPVDMPPDYPAFQRYLHTSLNAEWLVVTPAARELARQILTPPSSVAAPVFRAISAYTAYLLPERLRHDFGLRYGRREQLLVTMLRGALTRLLPRLPPSVRYFPAYHDAMRRVRGQLPHDRKSHAIARLWLKLLRSTPSLRGVRLRDLLAS